MAFDIFGPLLVTGRGKVTFCSLLTTPVATLLCL